MSSERLQAVGPSVNRPRNPSRRRFLTAFAGTAVSVALGYYVLRAANDADYASRPSRDFSRALGLIQSIMEPVTQAPSRIVEIKYPGLYPVDVDFQVEATNNADIPLEGLVTEQYGVDGLEFKDAKMDALVISPSQLWNGLRFDAPEKLEPGRKLRLDLSYRTGWDSATCEMKAHAKAVAQYYEVGGFLPSLPLGLGDPHEGSRWQEVESEAGPVTVSIIPDPTALKQLHAEGREEWLGIIRDRRLLLQYPLKDQAARDSYWTNPSSQNGRKIVEALYRELADAGQLYQELVEEVDRLPDLQQTLYDEKMVKAVENMVCDVLLSSSQKDKIENMIRDMLDEGIPEKRKYCAPLQAWLWHAQDEALRADEQSNSLVESNPLPRFRTASDFVEYCWRTSSISRNYTSREWKDFDDVVDRLSSPYLVHWYMHYNIEYLHWKSSMVDWLYLSPQDVFNRKKGDCIPQTSFATYCLRRSGWKAVSLFLSYANTYDHAVCVYRDKSGSLYYLDNAFQLRRGIFGPFTSVRDIGRDIDGSLRNLGGHPIDTYELYTYGESYHCNWHSFLDSLRPIGEI